VDTKAGGGGVRWYEFRLGRNREPYLYQQGTYAPDGFYRWMGSIGIDRQGNIGIGYSFGGSPHFAGQRFAARLSDSPLGMMTFRETILVEGAGSQTTGFRWEDYTTTAMDPSDDCTFWYVGDYLKSGAASYSTRIGSFRVPGCLRGEISGTAYFDRNHNGKRDAGEPGLPNRTVAYSGGDSGKVSTDAGGNFKMSLPADLAYADPVYSLTGPDGKGWTTTETPAPIHLKHSDKLAGRDVGEVCTAPNRGGENVLFWLKGSGKAILEKPGAAWKELINSRLHLVNDDGSRFTIASREGYNRLRDWLRRPSGTNTLHRMSVQLLVTALNVTFAHQDANVTVHDTVANDWPSVGKLIDRASALAAASGAAPADAERYRSLLESLNSNTSTVTPSDPSGCPIP
jgi:hypothetical protein